jgi:hypothetical protein
MILLNPTLFPYKVSPVVAHVLAKVLSNVPGRWGMDLPISQNQNYK